MLKYVKNMIDMEDLQRLYPIGIQTFSKIREGNYLYIDKTEYVYRMTHSASSYMFLSRPRRFGKSLLTSTLHSYFSGRKDLFHGLAMEKLEKEWTEYPVLHFDMSMAKHVDKGGLERLLDFMLAEYERTFAINAVEGDANLRLVNLIKRAYEQTGKKVVVILMNMMLLCLMWYMNGKIWMYCVTSCVTSTVR